MKYNTKVRYGTYVFTDNEQVNLYQKQKKVRKIFAYVKKMLYLCSVNFYTL